MSIQPGAIGPRMLHLDVTVTHPKTGRNNDECNNQRETLRTVGWAANNAARAKETKYQQISRFNNADFLPLAFESTGFMAKGVLDLIDKVVKHAGETRKIPSHVLRQYHINSLSIILQKTTAEAMIARSAILLGASLTPGMRHNMTYANVMSHSRAFVRT